MGVGRREREACLERLAESIRHEFLSLLDLETSQGEMR
jgi:hypothetical protein